MLAEAEVVAARVIEAFDRLQIPYAIGGSVASTVHGIPRLTRDVDIVAEIDEAAIDPLVAQLEAEFYIEADIFVKPSAISLRLTSFISQP